VNDPRAVDNRSFPYQRAGELMKDSRTKLVVVNVLVFVGLLASVEMAGQIVRFWRPSYDVVAFQPDRVLGWKQVPGLTWPWAGHHWYAADFRVDIHSNSLGFRDIDHNLTTPPDVTRVALLGDSFIEAGQVPFEATAAQRLQQRLNATEGLGGPGRWEVMNFGISNYGIGQYLLTWREHASRFGPRYVAVFVARLHMFRTVTKYEGGAFPTTRSRLLWIRPTFKIENDTLVAEPARDFAEFSHLQDELIRTDFSGHRIRRKRELLVLHYGKRLFDRVAGRSAASAAPPDYDPRTLLAVNLRILGELGREVATVGGRLAVIDVSRYFGDPEAITEALRTFCAENDVAYIPAYRDLMEANARGVQTHWRHDVHFNAEGNTSLSNSIYNWLAADSEARADNGSLALDRGGGRAP
jgi:hypothetical protein